MDTEKEWFDLTKLALTQYFLLLHLDKGVFIIMEPLKFESFSIYSLLVTD